MTPREYARHMAAARKRIREDHQRDIVLAWHIGAFSGSAFVGKLPELRTVIDRLRGTDGRQSFEDMKAQLATLSKLTGFPLIEVAKRAS